VKVLQIIDNLGMGGAETWLISLLRHWREQGDGPQVDFLATGGRPGVFDDEARALGAQIIYLRYGQARLPAFVKGFRRVLREGGYDVLHDHEDYASGWHFALGSPLPPVRVTHVHNPAYQVAENYGHGLRQRLTGRFGKAMIARYATHITGTSRQAITEHGFDAPAFDHIPKMALHCGFDPAAFAGDRTAARVDVRAEFKWPQTARIALFAGRIDVSPDPGHPRNHKNSGFAVSIAIAGCRRDPDLRVLFAGRLSVATPILEGRIEAAGLSDRIRLIGVRRDIARLMLGADVLFFPSRSEGLGMVAVEAQAAGLPVLASTAVPRECVIISDLVTFLDVGAGAEAWADELLHVMTLPRADLAANRQVSASPFAIDNSAEALLRLYSTGVLT